MIEEIKKWGIRQLVFNYEPPSVVENYRKRNPKTSIIVYSYVPMSCDGLRLVRAKETPVLNMEKYEEEDVIAALRKNVRNEIRKTINNKEYSIQILHPFDDDPEDNYRQWFNLYRGFELAQGRIPMIYTKFKQLYLVGVYFNGVPVSGVVSNYRVTILRVNSIFSNRMKYEKEHCSYQEIGYAGKRAMYETILLAKKLKCSILDLAYGDETDAGISIYKRGFSNEFRTEYWYVYETKLLRGLSWLAKRWVSVKRCKFF